MYSGVGISMTLFHHYKLGNSIKGDTPLYSDIYLHVMSIYSMPIAQHLNDQDLSCISAFNICTTKHTGACYVYCNLCPDL